MLYRLAQCRAQREDPQVQITRQGDAAKGATWVSRSLAAVLVAAVIGSLFAAVSSRADARQWKPTAATLARDYAQIVDLRESKRELVLVWWSVPPMYSNSQTREVFDKYVVLGVARAKIGADGTFSYDQTGTPQASDGNVQPLTLLSGDKVPPVVAGNLVSVEGMLRQAAGPLGKGVQWFVFEGGAVHAYEKGELSVRFADETYTYDTPIPGCPQK
jgi:hypothetical protein